MRAKDAGEGKERSRREERIAASTVDGLLKTKCSTRPSSSGLNRTPCHAPARHPPPERLRRPALPLFDRPGATAFLPGVRADAFGVPKGAAAPSGRRHF